MPSHEYQSFGARETLQVLEQMGVDPKVRGGVERTLTQNGNFIGSPPCSSDYVRGALKIEGVDSQTTDRFFATYQQSVGSPKKPQEWGYATLPESIPTIY